VLGTTVGDTAPADLRGTAFGLFNLVGGGATLLASVFAGWLWGRFGAEATLLAGAASALAAMLARPRSAIRRPAP